MPRRMLVNATHAQQLRVAVLDGSRLENYQLEVGEQDAKGLTRGNIYRGVIANIQPSLNAAFIDYGPERHGFLAIQDVVPEAYYREPQNARRPAIDEVLEKGKPIVVQVEKEADGQKGASLTTNLSLAGRYLVLTPFDSTRGVSRKVEDEETRRALRAQVATLDVPPGMGLIVRTNALDQNKAALAKDLGTLLRLWKKIESEAPRGEGIRALYSDQDLLLRALRDHLDTSIDEVLVDTDAAFEKAEQYMRAFLPRSKTRLLRYAERAPLFERFDVEHLIDQIFERRAALPSGGSIVIDRTEALTAIDVNSGKATRAATQAETALTTNLEAAAEVARQLRLRDIGGLVVVDFIDMRNPRAQRKVEKELREAMKIDRARFTVGRISDNGLLEINRQRIQQALDRRTQMPCPACEGTGRIPAPETLTQSLLRRIEARASIAPIRGVRLSLAPEVGEAMREGRGAEIAALERQFEMRVEILPARRLQRHEQEFEWLDRDRSDPGPPPPWSVTALPEEVRWTSLGVVFASEERERVERREATVGVERAVGGRGGRGKEARSPGARGGRAGRGSHRRGRSPQPGASAEAEGRGGRRRDRHQRPEPASVEVERATQAPALSESSDPTGTPRPRRRRGRRRRGAGAPAGALAPNDAGSSIPARPDSAPPPDES